MNGKKLMSAVLTFAMLLTLLPTSALAAEPMDTTAVTEDVAVESFAEQNQTAETPVEEFEIAEEPQADLMATDPAVVDGVAQIGEQKFETLEAAVAAAQDGQTVTLLKDVEGDRINITKNLTIDGQNHTIIDNNSNGRAIWIDATDVALTLKNLTIDGQGKCQRGIQVNQLDDGSTWNNAKIVIDSCVIKGMTHYAINLCFNTTVDLDIVDSKITGWAAINAYGTGNKINVLRSELNGINDKSKSDCNNFCTVCLEGDTTGQSTVGSSDYEVVITDSTITAKQTTGNMQAAIGFNTNSKNSIVTLNNTNVVLADTEKCYNFYNNGTENKIVINAGGTFNADPTDYVADGYEVVANDDGTFSVVAKDYAAQIGEQKFETLQAAFDAAQDGQTITLLKNTEFADTIKINGNKAITLDLADQTAAYTGAGTYGVELGDGAKLTITGTTGSLTAPKRVIKVGSATIKTTGTPASLVLDGGTIQSNDTTYVHSAVAVYANNTADHSASVPCTVTVNEAKVVGGVFLFGNGAALEVNNGAELTSYNNYTIAGNGTKNSAQDNGGTEITINGGTITQTS